MAHQFHVAQRATLTDLPPHVWALVLRTATLRDIFTVAHVCRALHTLVTARATCACASADGWSRDGDGSARTRAFWTHMRHTRRPPWPQDWFQYVRSGSVALVALALRCGAEPHASMQYAIREASQSGHAPIVELLLRDARVDPAVNDQLAIAEASRHGHVAVVNLLLRDARIDPSGTRQYAIRAASTNGHLAVVERLLSDGRVDPSAEHQCALRGASLNGHIEVVQRLLSDARVDPSAANQAAIRVASVKGHAPIVERLLRDGRVTRDTAQLLHCVNTARQRGHDAVVACLRDLVQEHYPWYVVP